jgi:rhodanese-related sulfurtransferase
VPVAHASADLLARPTRLRSLGGLSAGTGLRFQRLAHTAVRLGAVQRGGREERHRETAEWNADHAPGALHLPLSRLAAGASLPAAVRGRPVITICRSGHRSQQAASLPAGRGFQASDVAGGMTARARAALPVLGRDGSHGVIA